MSSEVVVLMEGVGWYGLMYIYIYIYIYEFIYEKVQIV